MASKGYMLGLDEFTTALRQIGQEEFHQVFQHKVLYGNDVFWRQKFNAAMDYYKSRGLLADGALLPDFVDMLHVLKSYKKSFYGWIEVYQEDSTLELAVLMAVQDQKAVFALRQGERVRVRWTDPARAARTLIEQLPETPRNPMRQIAMAADDIDADWPSNQAAKRLLDEYMRQPRAAMGRFYTAYRTPGGVVERCPYQVTTMDHPDGRSKMIKDSYQQVRIDGTTDDELEKVLLGWNNDFSY
jgi:hypothetical protein